MRDPKMCQQNQIPFFEDAAQVFGGRKSEICGHIWKKPARLVLAN